MNPKIGQLVSWEPDHSAAHRGVAVGIVTALRFWPGGGELRMTRDGLLEVSEVLVFWSIDRHSWHPGFLLRIEG